MKRYLLSILLSIVCVAALGACSQAPAEQQNSEQAPTTQTETKEKTSEATTQKAKTVKIKDIHGEVEVPKNPTKIGW